MAAIRRVRFLKFNFLMVGAVKRPISHHRTTRTHTFNGPLSGTAQVSQYQKGKTNLDFTEARDSGWQWHQLGHNASLHLAPDRQPHQHTTTLMFFTGWMPFLPPNQQRQSTERTTVPDFVKISLTVAEISQFLWFLRWRPPPSWILKIRNFNGWFAERSQCASPCQIS